jgi:hypothetical protein
MSDEISLTEALNPTVAPNLYPAMLSSPIQINRDLFQVAFACKQVKLAGVIYVSESNDGLA